MKSNGIVRWFNAKKGFGYIEREDGKYLFLHDYALKNSGITTLSEGDRIRFDIDKNRRGSGVINITKLS